MYRRVLGVALSMPFILLMMPYASRSTPEATASRSSISQPLKQVVFSRTPGAPDPNEVFRLANIERTKAGLEPFIADHSLAQLASARADDMVVRHYYAHRNPDGKYYYDFLKDYGVSTGYSCENLDLTFGPTSSTQFISDWMASYKGHRECLLTDGKVRAGYATKQFTLVQENGAETTAIIVVAVHAQM